MDTAPRVSLFVLLDGPAAAGLRDYARAEEIPVAVAADIYLGQVAARAAAAGIDVISTWPSIVLLRERCVSPPRLPMPPPSPSPPRATSSRYSDWNSWPGLAVSPST